MAPFIKSIFFQSAAVHPLAPIAAASQATKRKRAILVNPLRTLLSKPGVPNHQSTKVRMQQQPSPATPQTAVIPSGMPSTSEQTAEAPPKQVALAMDCLAQAGRLIADIRIGADRLLEALFITATEPHQQSPKPIQVILKEEASMRQHLQNLRTIGWLSRHLLIRKEDFFPNLDDGAGAESAKKKRCVPLLSEELIEQRTLPDILMLLEKEVPSVKTSTYQRLEWLKRASLLPASESSVESLKDHGFHTKLGQASVNNFAGDKVSVIELLFPSIFRVIISLHPAGSTDPDALAFFSPDEGGSYVHARGFSIHRVFKHMTEHASLALQYFAGSNTETALYKLLHWVCSYRTILTKVCSKCGRLLLMDKQSGLFLPPVCRPYRNFSEVSSKSSTSEDQSVDIMEAFHIGCYLEEAWTSCVSTRVH